MSWTVLGEVYGRYTQEHLNELGIELRRVRSNIDDIERFARTVDYVPAQTSFDAANPDLLKLLVGPLYSNRPEIGLRELIQNAVDAVREAEELLSRKPALLHVERTNQDADVAIVVRCERDKKDPLRLIPVALTVTDRGIGMNLDVVQSYFLKAGASFRRGDAWRREFEDESAHSKVLRSGRFGVGALEAFLIGDTLEVKTRHIESSPERGIAFHARLDDEAVALNWVSCAAGTTITIPIPASRHEAIKRAFLLYNMYDGEQISYRSGICRYISGHPSVKRMIQIEDGPSLTLTVKGSVPSEGDVAHEPWRSIRPKDYSRIFWIYSRSVPYLICNGIIVVDPDRSWRSVKPLLTSNILRTPQLLVYDRDGKLPLNLQRTNVTIQDVSFSAELLADIVDDLLVLLCHKNPLVRFNSRCVRMEILTRGGGVWVSNPTDKAANHDSRPMLRH